MHSLQGKLSLWWIHSIETSAQFIRMIFFFVQTIVLSTFSIWNSPRKHMWVFNYVYPSTLVLFSQWKNINSAPYVYAFLPMQLHFMITVNMSMIENTQTVEFFFMKLQFDWSSYELYSTVFFLCRYLCFCLCFSLSCSL